MTLDTNVGRASPTRRLYTNVMERLVFDPAEEFEVMKTHTVIGARILSGSRSPALQMAEVIALTHHERWEGRE